MVTQKIEAPIKGDMRRKVCIKRVSGLGHYGLKRSGDWYKRNCPCIGSICVEYDRSCHPSGYIVADQPVPTSDEAKDPDHAVASNGGTVDKKKSRRSAKKSKKARKSTK